VFSGAFAFVALLSLYTVSKLVKRNRQRVQTRVKLEGEEVSQVVTKYGSIMRPRHHEYVIRDVSSDIARVPTTAYVPEQPKWVI